MLFARRSFDLDASNNKRGIKIVLTARREYTEYKI